MRTMLGLIYVNGDERCYQIYTPNNRMVNIYGKGESLEIAKSNFEKNLNDIIDMYNDDNEPIPSEILNVEIRYSTRNDFPIEEKILMISLSIIIGYIFLLSLREFFLPLLEIKILGLFIGGLLGLLVMFPIEKFYWKQY